MADCKFIIGFALTLLVAYDYNAATASLFVAPPTTANNTALETVTSRIVFEYQYNVSSTNMTEGSADYDKVKSDFEAALLQLFKDKMVHGVVGVQITGIVQKEVLWSPVLDIDFEIEVDKEKSPNYEFQVKDAIGRLPNMIVGGEPTIFSEFYLPGLDLTMYVTDVTLEVGIDKPFEVTCLYFKTNMTDVIGINNIKLLHKAPAKDRFENIASIYDNSVFENSPFNATKVNIIKSLGAEVTGRLTKNSNGETFIKYKWTYPKANIVGEFKCVVHWSNRKSNSGKFERSQTIKETDAVLKTVIERVVRIDKSVDALKNEVYGIHDHGIKRMDHFRTLEIESRAQRVKVEGLEWNKQTIEAEMAEVRQELMNLKQDKQKADVEIAGIKQELKDIHQDKQTPDVEIAGIKQELVEMKKNKQTMNVEIAGIKQEVLEREQDKHTMEVEMARIKQELDALKQAPMAMHNQIQNNINGLEQTTVKLTNQLTTMHTEQASSYSALSTSINNTRHIETGTLYCGDLSPGATEPVTTKFSSPYTGAPPKVYVSAGPFSIRVTTDTSKYIKLRGYLGHVDVEGFTFTCMAYSDSSDVDYQHLQWISFPTVL